MNPGNSWRRVCRLLVGAIVGLGALCQFEDPLEAVAAAQVQAGVARVNLTPPLEMKAALGGYGARMSKPATGVHDQVWVKALALVQGERRFVVVTADTLAFPPGFKAAVMARVGSAEVSSDQVMLLPSHTHTSLDMMALHPANTFGIPQVGVFHQAVFDHVVERVAKAIREAGRDLKPVRVGTTTTELLNRNRNRRQGGGRHDPGLTITRVDMGDGKPLAVLVNWTAHPTFMDDEDMLFSGDWPGHLQRTLESLIGSGVTAMFYNGAEGDQSPTPPANCGSNYERAEVYGREIGIQAWRLWEKTQPREASKFAYHSAAIALPKRQWHADFMKTGGAEYGLNETMVAGFVERLVPSQTRTTCLRLDDLLILGVPGELTGELGLEAKREARKATGAGSVVIGGLANEWVSYILSADEYRKGGYEASVSFYGEALGKTILDGILGAAATLKYPGRPL